MQCDMCGTETTLVIASIEGTELQVCKNCARFGKVLRRAKKKIPIQVSKNKTERKEPQQVIVSQYPKLIRQAREVKGMTQEQFAKKLNEKESIIQSMENGRFEPSISTARKLERILKITLIEEIDDESLPDVPGKSAGSGSLTIGDLIKVKK